MPYPEEIATALKSFDRACKRAEKLFAAVALGDREQEQPAIRAVDGLYDRASKPELRGDAAVLERCQAAHRARVAAAEQGRLARSEALQAASLEAERAYRASRPVPGSYEHELALLRGR